MNSIIAAAADSAIAAVIKVLGESITYTPSGGLIPYVISAIWMEDDIHVPPPYTATAYFRETDLTSQITPVIMSKGDEVTRGDYAYRVANPPTGIVGRRDGAGGITIYLRIKSHAADA
jgi:hypothetical protein